MKSSRRRVASGLKDRTRSIVFVWHLAVVTWRSLRNGPGPKVLADRPTWTLKRFARLNCSGIAPVFQCIPRMAVTEIITRSITKEPTT